MSESSNTNLLEELEDLKRRALESEALLNIPQKYVIEFFGEKKDVA